MLVGFLFDSAVWVSYCHLHCVLFPIVVVLLSWVFLVCCIVVLTVGCWFTCYVWVLIQRIFVGCWC